MHPNISSPSRKVLCPQKHIKLKLQNRLFKIKALVRTALARCFEGWDNYHRLNITNGNLYRENEMLSKINRKLKNENENLRSEVKDYKLLRKVLGVSKLMNCLNRQGILKVVSVKIHAQDK